MSAIVGAQLLLGRADKGELILLVGPEYGRLQQMAAEVGIEVRDALRVQDMQMLKAGVVLTGKSLALIASAPEVDGILDRAAFGPRISDLAYEADRVVYGGTGGSVVVHPVGRGTTMRVLGGRLHVEQNLGVVGPGETVVGLRMDGM